jgi:hypothetical protein
MSGELTKGEIRMEKPTIEQVAWVFRNIVENGKEDGSFRHLIYDHMGFGPEAYKPLYLAGGMEITNELGRKERAV